MTIGRTSISILKKTYLVGNLKALQYHSRNKKEMLLEKVK